MRVEEDGRAREGAMGDEVRRAGRGQVVESFESQEEYFETDPLFAEEPVEGVENGSDVFTGAGEWGGGQKSFEPFGVHGGNERWCR